MVQDERVALEYSVTWFLYIIRFLDGIFGFE